MIYDTAVIGLGPAGLKFAQEARKFGLNVIAFEKASIGGTCLNLGCVPTKTMLSCAEAFSVCRKSAKSGIQNVCAIPPFSYEKMCEKRKNIIKKLSDAVLAGLKNCGIEIISADAKIKINNNIASIIANDTEYHAKKIIAATGSEPYQIYGLEFDGVNILSSDDILNMCTLPKSILIAGSGAIGVEWARIFNTLGLDVTVVEKADSLLPGADKDISSRIERIFKISKIKYYKGTSVDSFSCGRAILSDSKEIECEKILVAAGRKKVYPESFTEKIQIKNNCRTNIENLFVIGDASDVPMLAHAASHQAKVLFNSLYRNLPYKLSDIPSVIYGLPELASIGLREQDLDNYKNSKIYKIPVSYLAKAWCDDEIEGFIKIITINNIIRGAHIVSKEASALITQIAIAMRTNMSVDDLKDVVFAHPTYSEGILEALENG